MEIRINQLLEGARSAVGLTVVIDVFRAFSLACYLFDKGAKKIIPVGDIEMAYRLKNENPEILLIGERNNMRPVGFEYGNSPHQIRNADLKGKSIVHTTSAGTQGLVNATNATELITGSFVNAGAIVNYIKQQKPGIVSLVCMGYSTLYPIEEDTFCAEYIKALLEGHDPDFQEMVKIIRSTSGKRFFRKDHQKHCPSEDLELCLDVNRFDFVLKAVKDNNLLYLEKLDISSE